jgi:hypothetical protein
MTRNRSPALQISSQSWENIFLPTVAMTMVDRLGNQWDLKLCVATVMAYVALLLGFSMRTD